MPEQSDWDRALVLDARIHNGRIRVRSVDYGDEYLVDMSNLRPLTQKLAELPVRTVKVLVTGDQLVLSIIGLNISREKKF